MPFFLIAFTDYSNLTSSQDPVTEPKAPRTGLGGKPCGRGLRESTQKDWIDSCTPGGLDFRLP